MAAAGRRLRGWWPALLALAVLAAGGCQTAEKRPPAPPSAAELTPAEPEPEVTDDLSTVIDHLERGEEQRARAVLVRLRDKTPDSEVVRRLLHQIDAPVEELLPGPYRQVEVRPGDSLSLIAARELGDSLLFYALARLNRIKTPARIPVGTSLRIPEAGDPQTDGPESASNPAAGSFQEVESAASRLARSGQVEQARRMLIERLAEGGQAPESTQRRLVDVTLQRVSGAGVDGEVSGRVAIVDEALSVVDAPAARARLVQARSGMRSRELLRLARALREAGDLPAAYARAGEAAALAPASNEVKQLVEELEGDVVDSLHGRALEAWRDRDVDLAIRNWESLLEIAPDFEPARIYLERARSLRLRLDEP